MIGRPSPFWIGAGRYISRQLYWRWKYKAKDPILARHACLGADVLALLQPSHKVVNVQKGRVDYLVDCWQTPECRAKTLPVVPYIKRQDVISCVMQEEILYDWMKPESPRALFMDSMAEHADQRFIHRSGKWSFLSSYTDLVHTMEFKRDFNAGGLLPITDLEKHFGEFFERFRSRFGNIPIFYLHFPVKLDERQKFRDRYWAILQAVDTLAPKFQPLYSLAVDEEVVDWDENRIPDMWNFPYHYNKTTYETFAEMVRATGAWPS